ncbi:MAG: sulfite exporter TauE/SafE family protein [Fibrobacterota bacterium]
MVSCLTLFSGFGLGTLLMPAFAVFFPVHIAIAATAVVHLSNNLFKIFLVGKDADRQTVLLFAVPAAIGALVGSYILFRLYDMQAIAGYVLLGKLFLVYPIRLAIGILIVLFAFFELVPRLEALEFDRKYLSVGGMLSGFFGGISGMQGALRSAFLARSGLRKEAFIGTNVICAVVVDLSRLTVYGTAIFSVNYALVPVETKQLVLVTTLAAFIGSFVGKRLMKKVTVKSVQRVVGVTLLLCGLAMSAGLI